MNEDAIGIVQEACTAFNDLRIEDFLGYVSDDIHALIGPNDATVGKDGLTKTILYYSQYFTMHMAFPELFQDVEGDTITTAALLELHAVYHTTEPGMPEAWGQEMDILGAGFFDVRDGKLTRISMIFNYAELLVASDRAREAEDA